MFHRHFITASWPSREPEKAFDGRGLAMKPDAMSC